MKKFSVMKQIADLFLKYTGERPESIEELPSSGSNRRYFRVSLLWVGFIKKLLWYNSLACVSERLMAS